MADMIQNETFVHFVSNQEVDIKTAEVRLHVYIYDHSLNKSQ